MTKIKITEENREGENILLYEKDSQFCPRIGERIFYGKVFYEVVSVIHHQHFTEVITNFSPNQK